MANTTTKKPPVLTERQWDDLFMDSVAPSDPANRLPTDPADPFWFAGEARPVRPGVATQKTLRKNEREASIM